MKRLNIDVLTNINYSFIKSGKSVCYFAFNKMNNKYGILKKVGTTKENDNDVREMLGSQIFELCNVNHAIISLMEDNLKNHYAFSYYVLKKDEKHIEISEPNLIFEKKEQVYFKYFQYIEKKLLLIKGISYSELKNIINQIKIIIFLNAIINNCNSNLSDMNIIQNINTLRCSIPIAYDFGESFIDNINKDGIFRYLTPDEYIDYVLKYDFLVVKKTIVTMKKNLTFNKIEELFNQDFVSLKNKKQIKDDILKKVKYILNKFYQNEKINFLQTAKIILMEKENKKKK